MDFMKRPICARTGRSSAAAGSFGLFALAVALAPNWHRALSMSCNYRVPLDDFGFREMEFTAVGLGHPDQVGRGVVRR
jgi:hypothetical protein